MASWAAPTPRQLNADGGVRQVRQVRQVRSGPIPSHGTSLAQTRKVFHRRGPTPTLPSPLRPPAHAEPLGQPAWRYPRWLNHQSATGEC